MSKGWQLLGGLTLGGLASRVWAQVRKEDFSTCAAAAAYYALAALVPFLGLLVTLAANLIPTLDLASNSRSATLTESQHLATRLLPAEAVPMITRELSRLREAPPVKLLSVGLVLSVWFSSGVFGVLIDAMNRIQGVPETRPAWRVMLTAAGLTLLEAVIMLGTMALLVVWPAIRGALRMGEGAGPLGASWEWIPVIFGALLSFAVTARVGPSSPPRWRWVTPGAIFGTVAFVAATLLLRIYLAHWGNYANSYGSLAVVMLLTTWFWIVAFIVLVAFQIDKIIDDESAAK